MSKVWFITGAGSGIGAGAARAALKAGDRVVATGRNVEKVRNTLRDAAGENLEVLQLDVSDEAQVTTAVDQAVKKFGRIDVVVSSAGYSLLGNFEELGTQDIQRQFATNFWGVLYVMRAALPVMRKQRSGHIVSISSAAGLVGFEFCTAYAASKFGLEGWMESLHAEVAPFGITTTVVNPGFFRTELLTEQSTNYAKPSIEDYDERRSKQIEFWKAQNGLQPGDPAKLARALIMIDSQEPPPRRFVAGADAIALVEQKVADLKAQIDAERDLSTSLAFA